MVHVRYSFRWDRETACLYILNVLVNDILSDANGYDKMINGPGDENNPTSDYRNYIIYRARLNLFTEPAESSASKCERYISGCLPHVTNYTSPDCYKECILSYLKRLQDNGCLSVGKEGNLTPASRQIKKIYLKDLNMTKSPTKTKHICISPSDARTHIRNKRVSQTNRKTRSKTKCNDESKENILQNILLFSRSLERASRRKRRKKTKESNCTNDKVVFVDKGNEGDVSDSEPDVIDENIEFQKCHTKANEKRHEQDIPLNRKLDFLDDWESSKSYKSEKSYNPNIESYNAQDLEEHSCGSDESLIFSQSEHESEFEALLDNFETSTNADDTRGRISRFLNNWCPSDNDEDNGDDLRRKITKAKLKSLRVGLVLEDMLHRVSPNKISNKEYKDKMAKCLMGYAQLARKMNAGGIDSNINNTVLENYIARDEFIANEEPTVGKNGRKLVKSENYRKTKVDRKTNLKQKYNKIEEEHKEKDNRTAKLKRSENTEEHQHQSPVCRKSMRISSKEKPEKNRTAKLKMGENTEENQHQTPETVCRKSMRVRSQEKHEKKAIYECFFQAQTDSQYRTLSRLFNSSIITSSKRKRRRGVAAKKKSPLLKKDVAQQESKLASSTGNRKVSKSTARKFGCVLENKSQKRSFGEDICGEHISMAVGKENRQQKSTTESKDSMFSKIHNINARNCSAQGSKKRKLYSMDNWIDSPEYFKQFSSM